MTGTHRLTAAAALLTLLTTGCAEADRPSTELAAVASAEPLPGPDIPVIAAEVPAALESLLGTPHVRVAYADLIDGREGASLAVRFRPAEAEPHVVGEVVTDGEVAYRYVQEEGLVEADSQVWSDDGTWRDDPNYGLIHHDDLLVVARHAAVHWTRADAPPPVSVPYTDVDRLFTSEVTLTDVRPNVQAAWNRVAPPLDGPTAYRLWVSVDDDDGIVAVTLFTRGTTVHAHRPRTVEANVTWTIRDTPDGTTRPVDTTTASPTPFATVVRLAGTTATS